MTTKTTQTGCSCQKTTCGCDTQATKQCTCGESCPCESTCKCGGDCDCARAK